MFSSAFLFLCWKLLLTNNFRPKIYGPSHMLHEIFPVYGKERCFVNSDLVETRGLLSIAYLYRNNYIN